MEKLVCCICFCLSICLVRTPDAFADDLIVVLKSRRAEPYELALRGLRRILKEKGQNATFEEFLLKDVEQPERLSEIGGKEPQLFVALGSAATSQIAQVVKSTPVVFCMVLNPVASGFVRSMTSSGNNLTGASLDIPLRLQFEALRSIVPHAKKMGVIYNPEETGSVVQQARKTAREMGLDLVAISIATADKVPDALSRLDRSIDALWSVADSTTFSSKESIKYILEHTVRNKIPFVGLSPAFVEAGALMALAADYQEIGAQCGGLASRVLKGDNPSSLPITTPQKVTLHVNLNTAKSIGLKIPAERLKGATVVR